MDIGIIIVNWNTRDLLRRCLETVYASEGDFSYEVVVVDNGSSDGSVDMVAEEFPQATLIHGHGNVGYPRGNNIGLRHLGYTQPGEAKEKTPPRWALLLNPDTELPKDALARMLTAAESDPDTGVIGPRLELRDGSLDLACRRSFPSPDISLWRMLGLSKAFPGSRLFARYNLTYLDERGVYEVDSVVGAFMMVRGDAIGRVGLMDEQFFMYGEDLDWCKRIKEAGYRVVYHGKVTVLHVKRAASRQSDRARFEFTRAMLLFYRKHYAASTGPLMNLIVLAGLAIKGGRGLWPEIRQKSAPGSGTEEMR